MGSDSPIRADRCLAALVRGGQALKDAEYWADGVELLIEALGPATGASRVWIFQLLELQTDAVVQDYVFEWAADARYRQLTQRRFRFFASSLNDPLYRRLVDDRLAGRRQDICVPSMAQGPLKSHLESQGIQSMATVPIFVHGHWWGTLGVDDCERAIGWEGAGLDALSAAAELIAAAIYRHQLTSRSRQIELFHRITGCGVWEVSLRNGRVWCSRALKVLLGYPETYPRVPVRRMLAHVHRDDRGLLWESLRRCMASDDAQWRLDVRLDSGPDRRWVWHEVMAEVSRDERGLAQGVSGVIIEISQRKRSEQSAREASEFDALTGVLNRRGMDRLLQEWLASVRETSPPVHLVLLDIDHFKAINDRYGHLVGDGVLKLLARRIRSELRVGDGLVRVGGEEFAVLMRNLDDDDAEALAERIRRRVCGTPFRIDTGGMHRDACNDAMAIRLVDISISLGMAKLPLGGDDLDARRTLALAWADSALYAAKHAGRNRVMCYAG
ncbi:sensor domain-containing diguanylate cyclase [Halomonas sp. V046]|uniref:sensor domain-containing diguanylate cyclase n=1 Tax=Halomonas sp. V046 TaxID=3459611 RepID=UPI00404506BD